MIEMKEVSKKFRDQTVLSHCNLSLSTGKTLVLGKNGSGKTTLLNLLVGLLRPDHGKILFYSTDVQKNPVEVRRNVAYADSYGNFPKGLTVRELFEYLECFARSNSIDNYIQLLELKQLLRKNADRLSSGEKQLVKLAMAFSMEKRALLLDEPLTHIDTWRKAKIMTLVSSMKADILWVSHGGDIYYPLFQHILRVSGPDWKNGSKLILDENLNIQYRFTVSDIVKVKEILNNNSIDFFVDNGEFVVRDKALLTLQLVFEYLTTFRRELLDEYPPG